MNKKENIYKLDSHLDRCGILRAGDRIQESTVSEEMKHPVLIAINIEIVVMIIRQCHENVADSGRSFKMK